MKPVYGIDTSKSCSCTTCVYQSDSEYSSVRKLLDRGSKIDKLYFGKYIPLRERKLLNKLVRTRAVYDDIRNQLISGSSISLNEKPNLKLRQYKPSRSNEFDDSEKSSALLQIVDLVDKGKVLEHKNKNLNECCSCCDCGPNLKEYEDMKSKPRRHRYVHKHENYGRVHSMSGTSMISKEKIGRDHHHQKGVRFKAKHIRSEPCTCISKISGMLKRHSHELSKKLRHDRSKSIWEQLPPVAYEDNAMKRRKIKSLRIPHQKITKSNARLMQSMGEGLKKIKESKEKLEDHIKAGVRLSIENMKEGKSKIREGLKTRIKKPTRNIITRDEFKSFDFNVFPIKKDSIAKYKEQLERKRRRYLNKYKPCQRDCYPGECDPRECYRILKLKRKIREKSEAKESNEKKKAVEKTINASSSATNTAGDTQDMQREVIIRSRSGKILRYEKLVRELSPGPQKNVNIKTAVSEQQKEISKQQQTSKIPKADTATIIIDKEQHEKPYKTKLTKDNVSSKIQEYKSQDKPKQHEWNVGYKIPQLKNRSVKSVTGLTTDMSQLKPRSFQQGTNKRSLKNTGIAKVDQNYKHQKTTNNKNKQRLKKTDVKLLETKSMNDSTRQAVRISSSFNFSIELYKDKTLQKKSHEAATQQNHISQDISMIQNHRTSQTKFKKPKYRAQADFHRLKRCVCTLKLMAKRKKSRLNKYEAKSTSSATQSKSISNLSPKEIEVKMEERTQTKDLLPHLDSYVCPVGICIPNECDPIECLKVIPKRKMKNRSAGVYYKKRKSKSISSLSSKSVTNFGSKNIALQSREKTKNVDKRTSRTDSPEPKSKKQTVRIDSSFSFNIEFNKDKPYNTAEPPPMKEKIKKHNTMRNQNSYKKSHIHNRRSQISTSTTKSKYTLTKHHLRRCFCTLKLSQSDKRKLNFRKNQLSQVENKHINQLQPEVTTKSVGTEKRENKANLLYELLPFECEPGECIPDKCDPNMCIKLMNKRQMKILKRHTKFSNTDYRRTKSTSSFTSKTASKKTKLVQSSEFPARKYKEKNLLMQKLTTNLSSPERQIVRIGSSFSFNIEFFKDKKSNENFPQNSNNVVGKAPTKTSGTSEKSNLKERGYQKKIKQQQKSTSVFVKRKNKSSVVNPHMKRCYCTLKLQTAGKGNWDNNLHKSVTVGTLTPTSNKESYQNLMMTKSTKTKSKNLKFGRMLKPYECEPLVCIPRQCDPYQCLQRIEKRINCSKETGILTNNSKIKSASSMTQQSFHRSKAAATASKLPRHKVMTKTPKSKIKNNITPLYHNSKKSQHRAVRIGSNFSFNVEFKKDKSVPMSHTKQKEKLDKNKWRTGRDVQVTETKKASKATGVRPILKKCFCTLKLQGSANKTFATRKNSSKHLKTNVDLSKIYAVSRVTVDKTGFKQIRNNVFSRVESNIKEAEKFTNNLKELSFYKSHFNIVSYSSSRMSHNYAKPCFPRNMIQSENCLLRRKNNKLNKVRGDITLNHNLNDIYIHNFLHDRSQITEANSLPRQRYYAMNIHIPNKLKPYECEPGVCVPNECDPHECQKLIMKRLMKRVSRMSGTNSISKSISSSADQLTSSFPKKIQSKQARNKTKKPRARGIEHKSYPNRLYKKTVRVGSSFNFNAEFSKNRNTVKSADPVTRTVTRVKSPLRTISRSSKTRNKHLKTTGTRNQATVRHDQDIQSIIKTENTGSEIKPIMERCFCTLKLQKKGKRHKKELQTFGKGAATTLNVSNHVITAESSQNTELQKPLKLLPYECEPQVCVPGECDPYECLERIKNRYKVTKNFGTVTRPKISKLSMTAKHHIKKRMQGNQINSKVNREARLSQKTVKTAENKQTRREAPARQAVRIGSNINFSVEFYNHKTDLTPSSPIFPLIKTQHSTPQSLLKPAVSTIGTRQKFHNIKVRNRGSQDWKSIQHRSSQIGNMLSHASTMTVSFVKRCFCTAKLHKKDKIKTKPLNSVESKGSQNRDTKSFLQKCFCLLKFKNTRIPDLTPSPTNANVHTETNANNDLITIYKVVKPKEKMERHILERYECEPGACVPGQCNPYECNKLIKVRNSRRKSTASLTEKPRTKSISSSFKSSKTSKGRMTQSNLKTRTPKPTKTLQEKEYYTNKQPIAYTPSNRQVVKIGSQLSFNVEFYKDRTFNAEEVQAAAKAVKHHKISQRKTTHTKTQNKPRTTRDSGSNIKMLRHNQESQSLQIKTQDRATGVGPLLKRCFCTLKLQKQINTTTQGTNSLAINETPTLYSRGVMTQRNKLKLKPYECEPNICIPYECDPYECDKLIKKRLLKELNKGTTTLIENDRYLRHKVKPYKCEPDTCVPGECNPYECKKRIKLRNIKYKKSGTSTRRFKSKSSDIRSIARRTQFAKSHENRRSKPVASKYYKPKRSHGSSFTESARQSVRIGSGFSFDIEFFKDKCKKNIAMIDKPKIIRQSRSIISSISKPTRSRKMQHFREVRRTNSQTLDKKMQDTGINPFLKRCFCTLKLQKSSNIASDQSRNIKYATGPKFDTISRAARNKSVYLATFPNLLPYECEPGVCTPDECDPYECKKIIKKRLKLSQVSETDKPRRYSTSSSTFRTKRNTMKSQADTNSRIQKPARAHHVKQDYKIREPKIERNYDDSSDCRVGSSLNINIEFYKKRIGSLAKTYKIPNKPKKTKSINISRNVKTRSKSINSNNRRRHHKLQTIQSKTESKSTGVSPKLKRCVCTLALQKNVEEKYAQQKNKCLNVCMKKSYIFNKEIGVGIRKNIPILDPYECEPNVCIPGQCDPYECYERIKLRRMRDSGTATVQTYHKYASSSCKDPECKNARTQFMKRMPRKESTSMMKSDKIEKAYRHKDVPSASATKEVTRFGSNITFNIEFYKERNDEIKLPKRAQKINNDNFISTVKIPKLSTTEKKFKDRASYSNNTYGRGRKCQADCIATTTKGTGMTGLLKRCFCTLNLRKNGLPYVNKESKPKIISPDTKKLVEISTGKPVRTETKKIKNIPGATKNVLISEQNTTKARTRNKHIVEPIKPPKHILEDYECEPNICTPGKCNPHECLERINRRKIRRQSRKAGTHKRPSQVSISSMASKFVPRTSKKNQFNEKRVRQVSRPHEVSALVEESRFTHMFDRSNKHSTRYGSNISFNIEFYKKKSQDPISKLPGYEQSKYKNPKSHIASTARKLTYVDSKTKLKHKAIGNNICNVNTCDAQVDGVEMINKAAGMHNILKRCFCSLKLQRHGLNSSPVKVDNVVNVNRLSINNTWINTGKKSARQLKTEIINGVKKPNNDLRSMQSAPHDYNNNEYKRIKYNTDMQTIYPYIPSKFHKNISKIGILPNDNFKTHPIIGKSPYLMQRYSPDFDYAESIKVLNKSKSRKHTRKTEIFNFKLFIVKMFKRLFLISRNKESLNIKYNQAYNTPKNLDNLHIQPLSLLKTSKSERPTKLSVSAPKKSRSLKVTLSDKRKYSGEITSYQKNKLVYSRFQCGDSIPKKSLLINNFNEKSHVREHQSLNYAKSPIKNNKDKLLPPYEDYKIVQMALVSSSKRNNNKKPVKSTEIIQIQKQNKEMNTTSPGKMTVFIQKCVCALKGKQIEDTSIERTGIDKMNVSFDRTNREIHAVTTSANNNIKKICPCPKRKFFISSGDTYYNDGGVSLKEVKVKQNHKNNGPAQSGDAAITEIKELKKKEKQKNTKQTKMSKIGENNVLEVNENKSINENKRFKGQKKYAPKESCLYPQPCPCCKKMLKNISKSFDASTVKAVEGGEAKKVKTKSVATLKNIDGCKPQFTKIKKLKKTKDHAKGNEKKITGKDGRIKCDKDKSGQCKFKNINDVSKKKMYGAKLTIKPKGDPTSKHTITKRKQYFSDVKEIKGKKKGKSVVNHICVCNEKNCVCGSQKCAKEFKKLTAKQKAFGTKPREPCVCGSAVCVKETMKKSLPPGKICECQQAIDEEIKKGKANKLKMALKAASLKKRQKADIMYEKRIKKEDKLKKKIRLKNEKQMNKDVAKYKESSDSILLAESVFDVLKLGFQAGADVAECTSRAVTNPRHTVRQLQMAARDPKRAFSNVRTAMGSRLCSTFKRVKSRFGAMKSVQSIKGKLEDNSVTGYLLHIGDSKARDKLKKKRMKKKREKPETDFECSLFMSSLRKRPCIAVYYLCPWFYPHCLSMLNLWKQFTDVLLFLLAVAVWSPFILGMEICRAMVCCFFCTG